MLIEELNKDIVEKMKSKNTVDLTILRTLKADISKVAIDTKKEIDDNMVLDVISKCVKQFKDALEIYTKANQTEHIEETNHRLELISKYLPEQLSDTEVIAMVNQVIKDVGAETKKDMGKVMKVLTPQLKGKFDSKRLSTFVNELLK